MYNPSISGYARRYLLLVCSLVIMAMGVALSINAHMGISPISCLPYVLSRINNVMTVGQFTAAMHVLFVLFQIILLRREFAPYQLLQLLVGVVLGLLIDTALNVLAFLRPSNYLEQLFMLLISNLMVGFGMYLEVKAGVLMVAGEGLVKAISLMTKVEFGKIKVVLDCSLVLISLSLGLYYAHMVIGVREGTIFAAIFVGWSIKYLNTHVHFFDRLLQPIEK